jgi:PAS domain S-box-containing protein
MFLLPVVVADPHGHAAILVDSSVLTVLSAPPIWWLITQRRRANQALQRSEEHFRSLIENASDIITVLGKDGAISFVSPSSQRVLGYEPEELIGKNVFNFVHPDDLTSTLARFSNLVQDPDGHQSAEFRFRHADGSWLVLEAIGRNALHDPAAATLIINSRDIRAQARGGRARAKAVPPAGEPGNGRDLRHKRGRQARRREPVCLRRPRLHTAADLLICLSPTRAGFHS